MVDYGCFCSDEDVSFCCGCFFNNLNSAITVRIRGNNNNTHEMVEYPLLHK